MRSPHRRRRRQQQTKQTAVDAREKRERGRGQCILRYVSGTSTKGKQNVMSSVTQHLERPLIGTQNVMSGVISNSRLKRPLNFC
jgi:hypothetical protein